MKGLDGEDIIDSNWICELSCRRRTLGACRAETLLLARLGTIGDRDMDLRVTLDTLKGDSLTLGLLDTRLTSSTLISES